MADVAQVELLELGVLGHQPVLGGRLAEHGDSESLEQVEALLYIEAAVMESDLGAAGPRAEEHVPDRLRRARAGGAPDQVTAARVEPVFGLEPGRPRIGMGMNHPLRFPHRARRVQDEGGVVSGRVVRRGVDRIGTELGPDILDHDDPGAELEPFDQRGSRGVDHDDLRAGVLDAEADILRLCRLGTRNRDEACLECAEDDREPRGLLAHEHEHPVAGGEPAGAKQGRPAAGIARDHLEGASVDDAFAIDVRQRRAERVTGGGLDDVAREIEPGGDRPVVVFLGRLD